MKNTFKVTIDSTRRNSSKPQKSEIGTISKNLKTQHSLNLPSDFSKILVQPYSVTFCCSTFVDSGKRLNANWEQQSVFALDFDNGINPEEVLERLAKNNIVANITYTSFSDTPELRKFRVLLFINKSVLDKKVAKFIITSLMEMFPEADKSCKDLCRMFFGGKELIKTDNTINDYQHLMDTLSILHIGRNNNRTRGLVNKDAMKYSTTDNNYTGIFNDASFESVFGLEEKVEVEISNTDYNVVSNISKPYNNGVPIEKFNFEKAAQQVSIFNDFINGKRVYHNELTGLASNLVHIKGGLKLMTTVMTEYNRVDGEFPYTDNSFSSVSYYNYKKYYPQRLENFSPYKEDHIHLNIIEAQNSLKRITRIEDTPKKLKMNKETESKFITTVSDFVNKESNKKVLLVKCPTGFGKTHHLVDLCNKELYFTEDANSGKLMTQKTLSVAFPTHALAEEFSTTRMKSSHTITPKLPTFEDDDINNQIKALYASGLRQEVSSLVKDIAVNGSNVYSEEDNQLAKAYKDGMKLALAGDDTLITTHKMAMGVKLNRDVVVFDEDPVQDLMRMSNFNTSDLNVLKQYSKIRLDIAVIQDFIDKQVMGEGVNMTTKRLNVSRKNIEAVIKDGHIVTQIFDFLDCTFFMKGYEDGDRHNIHCIKKSSFIGDKTVVLSATANEFIYRKLFGEDLEVLDLMDMEQVGTISQITKYSFSSSTFNNNINFAKQKVGNRPVITFSKKANSFKKGVKDIYFWNTSGYDKLKGQNIAVVGTPHVPENVYFLYAICLEIDFAPVDTKMSRQSVTYNGYTFPFMTYSHLELRDLQLGMINGELVQAVGRARTLREECNVLLLSNFPLKETTEFLA